MTRIDKTLQHDNRLMELERRVKTFLDIVEKQNETLAEQTTRITALEARLPAPPTETTYKPLFDRWPGTR